MNMLLKKWVKNHIYNITGFEIKRKGGRNITVKEDDIFLVSYPKSGNTWVRFLLGNLSNPHEQTTFLNIEGRIPDIYVNFDKKLLSLPSPRILKSHEYFDPRYNKVIYIVRDPKSVAVSYYHHCIKFGEIPCNMVFPEFVRIFVQGKIDTYGSWAENVLSWIETRGDDDRFLLLKYEDIKSNTFKSLSKVADFIGLDSDSEIINRAIELSSFDSMKSLEMEQAKTSQLLKNTDLTKSFIRKGDVQEWKQYFDKELLHVLYRNFGKAMNNAGYDYE